LTDSNQSVRVAIVQAAPVFLDAMASAEKAAQLIGEAADTGAALVAFGEGWIPGYPMHAFAAQGEDGWWEIAAAYLEQAIDIPGPATRLISDAAMQAGVDVVIGVSERDPITQGTVYATQLIVGSEGTVIGRHRKLRASLHERNVWGDGDAAGLSVHRRAYGVLSSLSGWDHQMALPTYALAEQGAQFHVAGWPGGEMAMQSPAPTWPRQHLLSRAFAAQAGAYVLCAGAVLSEADIPEQHRGLIRRELTGDSAIIDPCGEIIAGPASGETILIADCSLDVLRAAKVAFDCAGHSARPDQLHFRHPQANDFEQNVIGDDFDDNGFGGNGGYQDDSGYNDPAGFGSRGAPGGRRG